MLFEFAFPARRVPSHNRASERASRNTNPSPSFQDFHSRTRQREINTEELLDVDSGAGDANGRGRVSGKFREEDLERG